MNMRLYPPELNDAELAVAQRTLIRLALEKTQEMLLEGKKNNWELVNKIETERRLLLSQCFESTVAARNSQIFSEALATMLHMNEELVALLNEAKRDAAARHSEQKHSSQAIGHYLDTKSTDA